jgi:hypothetical protein
MPAMVAQWYNTWLPNHRLRVRIWLMPGTRRKCHKLRKLSIFCRNWTILHFWLKLFFLFCGHFLLVPSNVWIQNPRSSGSGYVSQLIWWENSQEWNTSTTLDHWAWDWGFKSSTGRKCSKNLAKVIKMSSFCRNWSHSTFSDFC